MVAFAFPRGVGRTESPEPAPGVKLRITIMWLSFSTVDAFLMHLPYPPTYYTFFDFTLAISSCSFIAVPFLAYIVILFYKLY